MSQRPPANRMMLQQYKARSVGATKGWKLLKKKRDQLRTRFQAMLKEIVALKKQVSLGVKEAAFSYAKAQWAVSDDSFANSIVERAKEASVTTRLKAENVAGVNLPVFKMNPVDRTKDASVHTIGLSHGGAVINACRETHLNTLKLIIELASLQTSFVTLDEEIKMTSRRVNALEYVLIPRINEIVHYIQQEMDEQAREEFYRVKKVVEKKRQKYEREKAFELKFAQEQQARQAKDLARIAKTDPTAADARRVRSQAAAKAKAAAPSGAEAPSALEQQKDKDLIF